MNPKEVRLSTVSRLHFGFMDLNGDLGRKFGSLGVALRNPSTVIRVCWSDKPETRGGYEDRILSCLEILRVHFGRPVDFLVEVIESIPSHSGLGSGTQLDLAVAKACTVLWGLQVSAFELAAVVDRGKRSGVGVAAFEGGGFVMDGGHSTNRADIAPPPILLRRDFPSDWVFVVAIPKGPLGLSGDRENDTLSKLEPSRAISEEICRFTLLKLLPALAEKSIKDFGCALTEIDRRTGMFFQTAQDGVYSGQNAEEIVGYMLEAGAYGAGQSSWGPAIYGLTLADDAAALAKKMEAYFAKRKVPGEVFVSRPDNTGSRLFLD